MKRKYFIKIIVSSLFYVCNYSFSQDFTWIKKMGGPNSGDYCNGMVIDNQSNVITAGYFYGSADFDPGAGVFNLTSLGQSDSFISKLSPNGHFIWAKQLGGVSDVRITSLKLDNLGNIYVVGFFRETVDFDPGTNIFNITAVGIRDVFICKFDTNCNLIWAKSMGGTNNDRASSVAIDNLGNVYTLGSFFGTADFDPSSSIFNLIASGTAVDIFVSKIDSNGNFIWAKRLGGNDIDYGKSLTVDSVGKVYITGTFNYTADFDPSENVFNLVGSPTGSGFVCNLDSFGNFIWAKQFSGPNIMDVNTIALDSQGNIYTAGYFSESVDFDPGDNNYILNCTHSGGDMFISKLDNSGNFIWAKQMVGNSYNSTVYSLIIDEAQNIYSTGYFKGTVDFNPGVGISTRTSLPSWSIFVSKLDINGNYIWTNHLQGNGGDTGTSIALDNFGNVYTAGNFNSTISMINNILLPLPHITTYGDSDLDILILKTNGGSGLNLNNFDDENLNIYPNPNNGNFYIFSNQIGQKYHIRDTLGKIIHEGFLESYNSEIKLKEISKGLYFLCIENFNYKIIIK
jgi:hypothetical protein